MGSHLLDPDAGQALDVFIRGHACSLGSGLLNRRAQGQGKRPLHCQHDLPQPARWVGAVPDQAFLRAREADTMSGPSGPINSVTPARGLDQHPSLLKSPFSLSVPVYFAPRWPQPILAAGVPPNPDSLQASTENFRRGGVRPGEGADLGVAGDGGHQRGAGAGRHGAPGGLVRQARRRGGLHGRLLRHGAGGGRTMAPRGRAGAGGRGTGLAPL